MAQLVCTNPQCTVVLMYPRGANQVQCSVCGHVNDAMAVRTPQRYLRIQSSQGLRMHIKCPDHSLAGSLSGHSKAQLAHPLLCTAVLAA